MLINPVIEVLPGSSKVEGWEGCLSVPGLRGVVERDDRVRYRGFDVEGRPIDVEAEGFHARVVQHECDHLVGVLYPMRVKDFQTVWVHGRPVPRPARNSRRLTRAASPQV